MTAVVADVAKRQFVKFCPLQFFICHFPSILPEEVTVDRVENYFRMYQTTSFYDSILNKPIDEAWRDIGLLKRGGKEVFSNLSVVLLGILVVFHCNAECEWGFSLVIKHKTKYRASPSTDTISDCPVNGDRKCEHGCKGGTPASVFDLFYSENLIVAVMS